MKVRSILSLLPPSEANPACISTAMASTTCLNLSTDVEHTCSNSSNTRTTFLHFRLPLTLFPTITAAIPLVATATPTASPTANFPILPPIQSSLNLLDELSIHSLNCQISPPARCFSVVCVCIACMYRFQRERYRERRERKYWSLHKSIVGKRTDGYLYCC